METKYPEINELLKTITIKDDQLDDILKDLVLRYKFHKEIVDLKTVAFKWMGYFLLLSIPIISSLVTAINNLDYFKINISFINIIGITLTILTILNSTLKPSDKFLSATIHSVALNNWLTDLKRSLSKINNDTKKNNFLT